MSPTALMWCFPWGLLWETVLLKELGVQTVHPGSALASSPSQPAVFPYLGCGCERTCPLHPGFSGVLLGSWKPASPPLSHWAPGGRAGPECSGLLAAAPSHPVLSPSTILEEEKVQQEERMRMESRRQVTCILGLRRVR